MKKRSLVMALILVLVFHMMPIQVFATESNSQTLDTDIMLTGSVSDSDSLPDWVTSAGLTEENVSWSDAANTLTFLQDVTLQYEINIPASAGEVTVDLNGCNIIGDTYSVFIVNGAEVDFKDSAEADGTVESVSFAIYVTSGITNIYSGTYVASDGIHVEENGTVNVYGGNIYGQTGNGRGISSDGNLLIAGGTIGSSDGWSAVCAGASSTVITGGTLIAGFRGAIEYYGGSVDLSHYAQLEGLTILNGTDAEISAGTSGTPILLPEGAGYWLADEDGNELTTIPARGMATIISEEKLPAWATDAGLTILTASWDSVTNTLSFLEDVTLQQEMSIPTSDENVTIDLNGCHVTGGDIVFCIEGAEVTFKDSSGTDGKVTAENQAIFVYDGTANIHGGTYEGMDVLTVFWSGTVNVYGGTFNCIEEAGRGIVSHGSLSVEGGTINGGLGWSAICADGTSTTITGGSLMTGVDVMIEYVDGTLDLSGYADVRGTTIQNLADSEITVGTSGAPILVPEGYICKNENNEVCTSIPVDAIVTISIPPALYEITVVPSENGEISAIPVGEVYEGTVVTLTAEPAEGYKFSQWSVKDAEGNDVTVYWDGTPIIIMPASDVTVSAVFVEKITDLYVGGVSMKDGDYLAVGATEVSDTAPATGGYAYLKNRTLTLNNYTYEGEGYCYDEYYSALIYGEENFEIVLQGENQLTGTDEYGDGIVAWADVTISGTEGASLEISASDTGIHLAPNVEDEGYKLIIQNAVLDIHTVYSVGIDSNGVIEIIDSQLSINSESDECIYLYDVYDDELDDYIPAKLTITGSTLDLYNEDEEAIYAYGYVTIEDSVITAECQKEAIDVAYDLEIKDSTLDLVVTDVEYDGIVADGGIVIENSNISVDGGVDGIYSDESITISGSDLTITAGDDGISAYGELSMTDSKLTIDAPYGLYVNIAISITDSDAVINAEGCGIYVYTEDLNIVNSNLDVTSVNYEAVGAYGDINLTETAIVTPVNGQIITEEGYGSYIADAEGNIAYHVVLHAHRYSEAEFTWTKTAGNYTATAVKECECGYVSEGTVVVTSEITTEADCVTAGVRTYTATATFEDESTAESTEVENLAMTEHVPGEPVEENRVEATCTSKGSYDEVVYCSVCKTHEISRTACEIPATGHVDENKDNHCDKCNVDLSSADSGDDNSGNNNDNSDNSNNGNNNNSDNNSSGSNNDNSGNNSNNNNGSNNAASTNTGTATDNAAKSPATGDSMDSMIWVVFMSVSVLSLGALLVDRRKRELK